MAVSPLVGRPVQLVSLVLYFPLWAQLDCIWHCEVPFFFDVWNVCASH